MIRQMLRRLARNLFPTGAIRKVLHGPAKGTLFEVVEGMGVTYALGRNHWHFEFLTHHIKPGFTIYDVGANCGQMSLFFSKIVGPSGRVLAFEPVPDNVMRLKRNVALNKHPNVEVFEAAVAADDIPKRFCMDSTRHTMGTMESTTQGSTLWDRVFEVKALTLDSLSPTHRPPHLIKIDVEGGGLEVIEGALGLIEKHRPLIYFELHAADENAPELRALRLLRDRFQYQFVGLDHPDSDPLQPSWGPAVWCTPATLS